MRVLIASKLNMRESYGGSNRAFYLGRHLAEKVTVFHVGPDCSRIDYAAGTRSTGSLGVGAFVREIRRAIRDFNPDVVYAFESRANLACRLLRLGNARRRLVVDFNSSPAFEWRTYLRGSEINPAHCALRYAMSRVIEKTILSAAPCVVVASAFLRDLVIDWYRVNPDRVSVVPNGAPPEMFERAPSPGPSPFAALGDGTASALLIAPRQFYSNVEAVRFAHRAAERLERLDPGVRLVVLGGGPAVGTSPNVRYLGYVPDVVPFIDFADVCLLPYPNSAVCGGARLKSMEYLARGKPVLTTPEGIRGIDGIRDGVEVVIAPDNPNDFAHALSALIRDRSRHAALGLAAREFVALRHDWRLLARQLLDILGGAYDRS